MFLFAVWIDLSVRVHSEALNRPGHTLKITVFALKSRYQMLQSSFFVDCLHDLCRSLVTIQMQTQSIYCHCWSVYTIRTFKIFKNLFP